MTNKPTTIPHFNFKLQDGGKLQVKGSYFISPHSLTKLPISDENNDEITHAFRILHDVQLNKSNQDQLITFVE